VRLYVPGNNISRIYYTHERIKKKKGKGKEEGKKDRQGDGY
jgi:hypothetical protein